MFRKRFEPAEVLSGIIVLMLLGGTLLRQTSDANHQREQRRLGALGQSLRDQPTALLSMPLDTRR